MYILSIILMAFIVFACTRVFEDSRLRCSRASDLKNLVEEKDLLCLVTSTLGLKWEELAKLLKTTHPSGFVFIGELPVFTPDLRRHGYSVYRLDEIPEGVAFGWELSRCRHGAHWIYHLDVPEAICSTADMKKSQMAL